MIRPLVDEREIDAAFALFSRTLLHGGEAVESTVGYTGGSEVATVTWHTGHKFWALVEPNRVANRFWCAFGTTDPTVAPNVPITCEINPPRTGYNRQCAGLFVRDSTGSIYLTHSGKVGGGRAGIGKAAFISSRHKNDIVPVEFPDGKEFEYIAIGRIDDSDFLTDLARFVHAVADFKCQAKG